MTNRPIPFHTAVAEAMKEEMARDERVFLLGEDVAVFGGLFGTSRGLLEEFGDERVRDTPMSEAAITGFGVGAALLGMRPIVEIMRIDWITLCMDQIVNQAAKMRFLSGGTLEVAMVIRTSGGAGVGFGGQHSQSFESWFVHVPGLKVVMPSNPYDCKGLLKAAIRDPNPVVFIEPVGLINVSGDVPPEEYVLPIGKADVKLEGTDATIVAWGALVPKALRAAQSLSDEGVQIEVVDPRSLYPLDTETIIASVMKTGRLVVAHEATRVCGFGAEVAAFVQEEAFEYLDAPIRRVAAPHIIFPANRNLERMVIPQEDDLIEAVKSVL